MSPRRPPTIIGVAAAAVLCALVALPSVAHQSPSDFDSMLRILLSPMLWLSTAGATLLFVLARLHRHSTVAPAVLFAALAPLATANLGIASLTASAVLLLVLLFIEGFSLRRNNGSTGATALEQWRTSTRAEKPLLKRSGTTDRDENRTPGVNRTKRHPSRSRALFVAVAFGVVIAIGITLPWVVQTNPNDPFAVRDELLILLPVLLLGTLGATSLPRIGRRTTIAGLMLVAVVMLLPFAGVAANVLVLSLPFWLLAAAGVHALRAVVLARRSAALTRAAAAVAFALVLLFAAPAARAWVDGVGRLAYVLLPDGPPPA